MVIKDESLSITERPPFTAEAMWSVQKQDVLICLLPSLRSEKVSTRSLVLIFNLSAICPGLPDRGEINSCIVIEENRRDNWFTLYVKLYQNPTHNRIKRGPFLGFYSVCDRGLHFMISFIRIIEGFLSLGILTLKRTSHVGQGFVIN